MRTPEILAPAGSEESLLAALRCGADAVYVGGKLFSARQNAANFDLPQLQHAVELCHLYGAKLYLTVNTLIFESEFPSGTVFAGGNGNGRECVPGTRSGRSAADPPDVPRCSRSRIHPDDDSHAGGRTLGKTARHLPCSSLPGTFPRRDRRSLSDRCGGRDFCPRGALHERVRTVRSVGSDRLQKCQPWQMRPGVPSPLFCKGSKKRVRFR